MIIVLALILLICGVGGYECISYMHKFNNLKKVAETYMQASVKKDDVVKQWRTKDSASQAIISAQRVDRKTADIVWHTRLDSLAKDYGAKVRQIKGTETMNINGGQEDVPAVVINETKYGCDTQNAWHFTEGDKWNSVTGKGTIQNNLIKDLKISWHSKDSIQLTFIQKHPLFHPIESTVGIKLSNPYDTLVSTSTYIFTDKPKRWGLGVHVGVGIDTHLQPVKYIGIGVNYNLIEW